MAPRKLNDEIVNDPLVRVYNDMNDDQLLVSLHTKDRPRNRTSMTGREVRSHAVEAEYKALIDSKKEQWLRLTSSDDLDPFGADAAVVKDIFGPTSTTVSNLVAARVEMISRDVEIGWGNATMKDLRMHTLTRKNPS